MLRQKKKLLYFVLVIISIIFIIFSVVKKPKEINSQDNTNLEIKTEMVDNFEEETIENKETETKIINEKNQEENITDISEKKLTCTFSIRCDTIFDNIHKLVPEKISLIPQNGIILEEQTVVFEDGESVFDVLLRETKKHKIHMEFENTPVYKSSYIEGIANLYEFDCGELSGWMYKVNGDFPNYGCSEYKLCDGDKVEWVYTCELGADVGNKQ